MDVESLIAKEAFKKGPDSIIQLTKLINNREESFTALFNGLN